VSVLTFGITAGLVLQLTEVVSTIGCPLAMPVATNWSLLLYVMLVKPSWEVTWMEARFPTITVTVTLPGSVSAAQAITLCPGPSPVTKPVESTVPTVGLALLPVDILIKFLLRAVVVSSNGPHLDGSASLNRRCGSLGCALMGWRTLSGK
jgi:hypothetical protein